MEHRDVSEEGRLQSPDTKVGRPRTGLRIKETRQRQEQETPEREMDDINKDGRDQGCGPEGQAQKSEVYDKGNRELVDSGRQEAGGWHSVPREGSFPPAVSLHTDLHPHFTLPTPPSPRIL